MANGPFNNHLLKGSHYSAQLVLNHKARSAAPRHLGGAQPRHLCCGSN